MSPKKPYTFRIEIDLLEGMKRLKARDGMPEGEAIRRALADFLRRRGVLGDRAASRRAGTRRKA